VTGDPVNQIADVIRASGLVEPGSHGIALLSGGPDSACLAVGLVAELGAGAVTGLHLNYGLRDDSGLDEERCRELCERLRIELAVERPRLDGSNLQAEAREHRYRAAERLRAARGADWIATGHTRSDLAETMLYRLASSPGRRALLGLAPRRGPIVRPLLAIGRAEARRLAGEAELPFHDDPSNLDPRFARVRVREEVMPVLRELNPGAEENLSATWAELAEEAEALEALAAEALAEAGAGAGSPVLRVEDLDRLHPAVRRLALRSLAGAVAGRDVPLGRERAAEIWRLAGDPEGGEVELGGGFRAICEAGTIRIAASPQAAAAPALLPVPGRCRFGRWELRAELAEPAVAPGGPEVASLDAEVLGAELEVRGWREGDRMQPLGLGGGKSLQDLFTDRRVPRSLRQTLPVVCADGRIAWVAGVAVSEDFKLGPGSSRAAILTATLSH
jgi:tRNA(Ile)-lysidine synthase